MYDQTKLAADEKHFAEQDKKYDAPRFLVVGFITLLISIGLIVFSSVKVMACNVQIVP